MTTPYFNKLQELGFTVALNDVVGTTWNAELGAFNGTLVGATASAPGTVTGFPENLGSVVTTDGVNDYVNMGNNAAMEPEFLVTMAYWIRVDGNGPESYSNFMGKGDDTYMVRRNNTANAWTGIRFTCRSSTTNDSLDVVLPAGSALTTPRLVVVTYDGAFMRFLSSDDTGTMVQRGALARTTGIGTSPNSNLTLMAQDNAGTMRRWLPGAIAAPAIGIDQAITLAQAQELYDSAYALPTGNHTRTVTDSVGTVDDDAQFTINHAFTLTDSLGVTSQSSATPSIDGTPHTRDVVDSIDIADEGAWVATGDSDGVGLTDVVLVDHVLGTPAISYSRTVTDSVGAIDEVVEPTEYRYDARYRIVGNLNWTYVEDIGPQPWTLSGLEAGVEYELQYRAYDVDLAIAGNWSQSVFATTEGKVVAVSLIVGHSQSAIASVSKEVQADLAAEHSLSSIVSYDSREFVSSSLSVGHSHSVAMSIVKTTGFAGEASHTSSADVTVSKAIGFAGGVSHTHYAAIDYVIATEASASFAILQTHSVGLSVSKTVHHAAVFDQEQSVTLSGGKVYQDGLSADHAHFVAVTATPAVPVALSVSHTHNVEAGFEKSAGVALEANHTNSWDVSTSKVAIYAGTAGHTQSASVSYSMSAEGSTTLTVNHNQSVALSVSKTAARSLSASHESSASVSVTKGYQDSLSVSHAHDSSMSTTKLVGFAGEAGHTQSATVDNAKHVGVDVVDVITSDVTLTYATASATFATFEVNLTQSVSLAYSKVIDAGYVFPDVWITASEAHRVVYEIEESYRTRISVTPAFRVTHAVSVAHNNVLSFGGAQAVAYDFGVAEQVIYQLPLVREIYSFGPASTEQYSISPTYQ